MKRQRELEMRDEDKEPKREEEKETAKENF